MRNFIHRKIMHKTLRPYQQEALDKLKLRLKQTTHPLLVNASVGAGKSLIIAELLKVIERAGWRALCLTMNSTLIQQNAETYRIQDGNAGIYCAGLNEKNTKSNIIFASPHSVSKAILANAPIKDIKFNLIVVDEAHNINPSDRASMYMRIMNHYGLIAQSDQYSFRVVGLTGTPYRGKGIYIVGEEHYFKEQVCDISTTWLIDNEYLVNPVWGITNVDSFDMKNIRVENTGKFKHEDLQKAVDQNSRLTSKIMHEVIQVINNGRNGAFIFASTIKHAHECMRSLPENKAAIITGKTPHEERKEILRKAKNGEIKYLVNVATMLVGVDVPNFDVCAWLRPTESLTLYVQGIGRVLRLCEGKQDALILDYAQNVERHGDIDNPIINKALLPKDKDDPQYCIKCYHCEAMNKPTARRCIGLKADKKRCDYYFEFKSCPLCKAENDKVARHCRKCEHELIDPNKKLFALGALETLDVIEAKYWVNTYSDNFTPIINIQYKAKASNDIIQTVYERYYIKTEQHKNIFYGQFVKKHMDNPQEFYPKLRNLFALRNMIYQNTIKTPNQIICKKNDKNYIKVVKKVFYDHIL